MDIKQANKDRLIKRVSTWKELAEYGQETPEGLLIPMGIYGLKSTRVVLDYESERHAIETLTANMFKKHKQTIVLVGVMS
jgi:hypothetical protein